MVLSRWKKWIYNKHLKFLAIGELGKCLEPPNLSLIWGEFNGIVAILWICYILYTLQNSNDWCCFCDMMRSDSSHWRTVSDVAGRRHDGNDWQLPPSFGWPRILNQNTEIEKEVSGVVRENGRKRKWRMKNGPKIKVKAFICDVGSLGGGETPFLFSEIVYLSCLQEILLGLLFFSIITASFLSPARTYAHNVINRPTMCTDISQWGVTGWH